MDDRSRVELVYDYEMRRRLAQSEFYKNTAQIWRDGKFSSAERTGDRRFLLKKLHSDKGKLSLDAFVEGYFASGDFRARQNLRPNEKYVRHFVRHYGRTDAEIMELAKSFWKAIPKAEQMPFRLAYNLAYIRLFDNEYYGYLRLLAAMDALEKKKPEYTCKMTSPEEYDAYGVDLTYYNSEPKRLVGASYIVAARKATPAPQIIQLMDEKRRAHADVVQRFQIVHHIAPSIVIVDERGAILAASKASLEIKNKGA